MVRSLLFAVAVGCAGGTGCINPCILGACALAGGTAGSERFDNRRTTNDVEKPPAGPRRTCAEVGCSAAGVCVHDDGVEGGTCRVRCTDVDRCPSGTMCAPVRGGASVCVDPRRIPRDGLVAEGWIDPRSSGTPDPVD